MNFCSWTSDLLKNHNEDNEYNDDNCKYSESNELNDMSNNSIKDYFKLPISYINENKLIKIPSNTKNDLELIKCDDMNNDTKPLYYYLFDADGKNKCENEMIELWSDYYTNDVKYITDTRNFIKKKKLDLNSINNEKIDNIYRLWNDLKYEDNFYEKYHYIEYSYINFLNNSSLAMLIFSILNICSPLFTLLSPIIMLIIPFILLKFSKNNSIDFYTYSQIVFLAIKQNVIGRLIYNFNDVSWSERISGVFMIFMYMMQTYYNIMSIVRFNNNLDQIHKQISELNIYLSHTIKNIEHFKKRTGKLKSYNKFNDNLDNHLNTLTKLYGNICSINEYKWNFNEISNLGNLMSNFYKLHTDDSIHDSILFSFGFNSYYNTITTIQDKVDKKILNKSLIVKNKKLVMNKFYYPALGENSIKNSINMNTNKIITGPNASGKTTFIKSCLFNILISQQIGVGFYEKCIFTPYSKIHCYLNIPDTSGRDSLFQAEARRCRSIMENINKNNSGNHFCIFDELYSGTNPEEAIASSYVFMKKLSKNKNVSYLLTTHFNDLCKSLENEKNIKNYHMSSKLNDNNDIIFTYKIKKGINKIKGGVEVLKKMNFPTNMINETINFLNESK